MPGLHCPGNASTNEFASCCPLQLQCPEQETYEHLRDDSGPWELCSLHFPWLTVTTMRVSYERSCVQRVCPSLPFLIEG